MPASKMRVEIIDAGGNRYTITFEGHLTRENALRVLDLAELLGGMPTVNADLALDNPELTKYDRLHLTIERCFPIVWFSSKDAQSAYEAEVKEPISLSTISTYLSRMADRGILKRSGPSNRHRFQLANTISKYPKVL